MLHIKVMGVVHRAKYMPIFSVHTPSSPDVRSRGQNTYYSKISHVAFQFKGSRAFSTMQAHILSLHIPWVSGVGQNVDSETFFSENNIAYQIDGNFA